MFDRSFALDDGHQRSWTVLAGFSGQLVALGFAMLIPLIYTDSLPSFRWSDIHVLPPVSRPSPPPESLPAMARAQSSAGRPDFVPPTGLTAPVRVPEHPAVIIDPPAAATGFETGPSIPGAIPSSGVATSGVPAAVLVALAPPVEAKVRPAEPPKVADPPKQVRVGGDVQEAKIINRLIPTYPALAKQARVSGVVELLGVIGRDGRVRQLRVVRGHPLLVPAAVDAVRQWTYHPTLLNGEPVEVIAPISIHFTLVQ